MPKEKTAPWLPCLSTVFLVNYYLINLAGELSAFQLGHTLFGGLRFGLGLGSGSRTRRWTLSVAGSSGQAVPDRLLPENHSFCRKRYIFSGFDPNIFIIDLLAVHIAEDIDSSVSRPYTPSGPGPAKSGWRCYRAKEWRCLPRKNFESGRHKGEYPDPGSHHLDTRSGPQHPHRKDNKTPSRHRCLPGSIFPAFLDRSEGTVSPANISGFPSG